MTLRKIMIYLQICMVQLLDTRTALFQTAKLGDNVTFECLKPQKSVTIMVWYKQDAGHNPRPIALSYSYVNKIKFVDEFQNGRVNISRKGGSFHLVISAVTREDTGTYHCGFAYLYDLQFVSSTFLVITGMDPENRNPVQEHVYDFVDSKVSLTLGCRVFTKNCAGEHSVYWFRHGSAEAHPGIMYTHGGKCDQCNKSYETGFPSQSCVYSLPKRNLSPSDAATYYCAVAMCGEILHESTVKLLESDSKSIWKASVLGLACANACSLAVFVVLLGDMCNKWRKKNKVTPKI